MRTGLAIGLLAVAGAALAVACGGRVAPATSEAAPLSSSSASSGAAGDSRSSTPSAGAPGAPVAAPSSTPAPPSPAPYPSTSPSTGPSTPAQMTAPSCASVSSTLCALAAQCSAVTDAGTDLFVFVNPVTVGLPSIDECEQTFTQECDPGEVPAEGKLTLLSDPAGCAAALTASACEGGVLTLPSSCAACVPASGDAGDETVCAL